MLAPRKLLDLPETSAARLCGCPSRPLAPRASCNSPAPLRAARRKERSALLEAAALSGGPSPAEAPLGRC